MKYSADGEMYLGDVVEGFDVTGLDNREELQAECRGMLKPATEATSIKEITILLAATKSKKEDMQDIKAKLAGYVVALEDVPEWALKLAVRDLIKTTIFQPAPSEILDAALKYYSPYVVALTALSAPKARPRKAPGGMRHIGEITPQRREDNENWLRSMADKPEVPPPPIKAYYVPNPDTEAKVKAAKANAAPEETEVTE